jgi:hypothetical protein
MDFNSADRRFDHLALVAWDGREIKSLRGSLTEDDIVDLTALLIGEKSILEFAVLQTPVDIQTVFEGEEPPSATVGILDFSHLLKGAKSLDEIKVRLEGISRRVAAGIAAEWEVSSPVHNGACVVRLN